MWYSLITAILLLSVSAGCSFTSKPVAAKPAHDSLQVGPDSSRMFSQASLAQALSDTTQTTKQILDRFLPGILTLSRVDTITWYYGSDELYDDTTARQLVIGRFVGQKTLAIEVNLRDTAIRFFLLDGTAWKQIGSEHTNIPVFKIGFEDLDGDGSDEIVTSTSPNMNGNSWKEVYYYSAKANTIRYAGAFSTDYEVKKDRRQIQVSYGGSWYMDESKTLYEWRQERLVPIRQIILAHDRPVMETGKIFLEYYENKTYSIEGLKLKSRELYNEKNKKQRQMWKMFFDRR